MGSHHGHVEMGSISTVGGSAVCPVAEGIMVWEVDVSTAQLELSQPRSVLNELYIFEVLLGSML